MNTFATLKKELVPAAEARNIFNLVKDELQLIEVEFERQARSNIQVIGYLGEYLRASGGKRVRPALLTLSNYAVGGDGKSDSSVRLATVMEMLHTATLVHDDIIDNADLRRNRKSVNARFGNQAAVLMGDWLYMSAFETSLKERSLEILDILTRLTRKMTEGELIQLTMLGNASITEDEYFDILRRKTAYPFSGCCEIGAILGDADPDRQRALRDYGMDLGVSFQLADDLLDLTANDKDLGKAAGADLLEGKLTLPLIRLIKADVSFKSDVEHAMREGRLAERVHRRLFEGFQDYKIIDNVRSVAVDFATSARKNLDILPETEYRSALGDLPSYVIDRNN